MLNGRKGWLVLALLGCIAVFVPSLAALTGQSTIDAKLLWLIFSVGCGVLLWAVCGRSGHSWFGLAAFALFSGGAGVLFLTEPLFFPNIRLGSSGFATGIAALLIAGQFLISAFVLRGHARQGWAAVLRLGLFRLLVLGALATLLSASIMNYLPQGYYGGFAKQIVFHAIIIGIQGLNIAALMALPAPRFLQLPQTGRAAAIVALVASGLLAWLAVEFVPHVEDELAYLFQARTFIGGHLAAPPPPAGLAEGLEYYLLTITDKGWFSVTTPGWPALLTIGTVLGQPWLVNPVLAAICVLLAFQLCARLCDRETAGLVAALLAVSPWFLGSAASLMPHLAALTFILLAWTTMQRAPERAGALLVAGLFMGIVFTIRQLEAVLIGTFTGAILLFFLWQRGKPGLVLAYGLGCVATGSLLLIYNYAMTGAALASPLQTYLNDLWHVGANRYGFGPDIGPKDRWGTLDYAAGHSLAEALVNTAHNLFYVNFEMFGWSIGSATLPLFHLLFGRQSRLDAGAWLIVLLIPIAHLGYWFSGSFYIGPRYWFAMLVPLIYLSARGILTLRDRAGVSNAQIQAVVLVLGMSSLAVFLTWRGTEKYHGYGNYDGAVRMAASTGQFGRDVVIYEGARNPGVALFLNDPYLPDNKPIFLREPIKSSKPPTGRKITISTE